MTKKKLTKEEVEDKEKRRKKRLYNRLLNKISAINLFIYRIVRIVKENPQVEVVQLFNGDVRNDLMLLAKVEKDLGYDFYHFKEDIQDEYDNAKNKKNLTIRSN